MVEADERCWFASDNMGLPGGLLTAYLHWGGQRQEVGITPSNAKGDLDTHKRGVGREKRCV